jgi:broad specificity phosphatase PhoE
MTRVLLAPHAETSWNVERRYQGQTDVPLNERGRLQAAQLGACVAKDTIHGAYSSDLTRAWDTAAAIAQRCQVSLRPEPRLRELHFGDWEGLTYTQIREADPPALAAWEADPARVAPPGGETLASLASRVQSLLDELRGWHAFAARQGSDDPSKALLGRESMAPIPGGETVLLVGHRGSLRVLLSLALGLPPAAQWRFRLDAASVSELELHANEAVLVRLNDTHHLRSRHAPSAEPARGACGPQAEASHAG